MSFDLHVTFSGLVLLAPIGPDRLWALMIDHPSTHKDHNHLPELVWPPPFTKGTSFDRRSIRGLTIRLSGDPQTATPPIGELHARVPGNLSKFHRSNQDAHPTKAPHTQSGSENWFDETTMDRHLCARVLLTKVADMTFELGPRWRYGPPGNELQLATHVSAVLRNLPGSSLDVPVSDDPTPQRIDADGGTLAIGFYNLPESELDNTGTSTEPQDNAPFAHFGAIRQALRISSGGPPRYIRPQQMSGSGEQQRQQQAPEKSYGKDASGGMSIRGLNPFACLTFPLCPDDETDCP